MTTTMINLLVIGKGWQEFQYGSPECQQQLKDNGIYIGSDTSIGYRAFIGHGASIGDRAKPKTIFITGSRHSVNYWGEDKIQICCIQKSIAEWEKEYAKVGIENSYSQDEIAEYRRYIEMIKAFHESNQSK